MVRFNDFIVWIQNYFKNTGCNIKTEVAFKHSALLLNEELFNDIFYNEHLLYNTCFEKGTFYFYQGRKFWPLCRFLCNSLCKNAVSFIVKSVFFISVCFGIVNSREVWKKKHNKLISSQNLNTRCLVVSILKSKSTGTSLPVNSFPYEQTEEAKPLGYLHAFKDCFIHYTLQVFSSRYFLVNRKHGLARGYFQHEGKGILIPKGAE